MTDQERKARHKDDIFDICYVIGIVLPDWYKSSLKSLQEMHIKKKTIHSFQKLVIL